MKKIISLVVMFACSLLVFSGCGYEGGAEAKGIAFTSSVYYVDQNVPFKLEYKVFPASVFDEDVFVVYEPHDRVNFSKYSFNTSTGIITVTASDFSPMEVAVVCGNYRDTCMVYLKQYPDSVKFEKSSINLSAGAMTELIVSGMFDGVEDRIDSSFYNLKVVSSDPSVVSVEDPSKLLIKSTGKRGDSTITCVFYTSDGSEVLGLRCSIDVNISNNVADAVIDIENNFIRDFTKTINISGGNDAEFDINPIFLDEDGFVVSDASFNIISLNDNVMSVVKKSGKYVLVLKGSGEVKIVVASDVYDADGNLVVFTLNFNVTIST